MNRYFSADRIHNGHQWLPTASVIEADTSGAIVNIHAPGTIPPEHVQYRQGILCPGFVNAHCHLELSHLKGLIEEGNQLVPFIQGVMAGRPKFNLETRLAGIEAGISETKKNGIVAVGDIANTTDTLSFRPSSGLHLHTFVESLGFIEADAVDRFAHTEQVYAAYAAQPQGERMLRQSMVPHAPYSVSPRLFRMISSFEEQSLISIHNEETEAENELFMHCRGAMFDLYRTMRIDPSFFNPSGRTSLQTYLPYLSPQHPLLLVHNTFMQPEDIAVLKQSGRSCYLCLCPSANWYIERRLPPVTLFIQQEMELCLGTDSLASNHQLSIWEEIKLISRYFPDVSLEQLITWGTYNGAKALGMADTIGSIAPGKRPGLVSVQENDEITVVL